MLNNTMTSKKLQKLSKILAVGLLTTSALTGCVAATGDVSKPTIVISTNPFDKDGICISGEDAKALAIYIKQLEDSK